MHFFIQFSTLVENFYHTGSYCFHDNILAVPQLKVHASVRVRTLNRFSMLHWKWNTQEGDAPHSPPIFFFPSSHDLIFILQCLGKPCDIKFQRPLKYWKKVNKNQKSFDKHVRKEASKALDPRKQWERRVQG